MVRKKGGTVPVIVKLLVYAADRPERCSINCIISHNGSSTTRWLYSALIDCNKLRSCPRCLKRRLKSINDCDTVSTRTHSCNYCADWDYNNINTLQYPVPKCYPCKAHLDSPKPPCYREAGINYIKPVYMTYQYLKEGCAYCFFNLFMNEWKKNESVCYMKVLGVKDSYAMANVINKAISLRTTQPNNHNCVQELKFPSMWTSGLSLHQCIDTPMHQLFQGLMKSLITFVGGWMKNERQHSYFCEDISEYMGKVKNMNLDWCKMESFIISKSSGIGTSGWVAENYLAFARLLPVIYGHIPSLTDRLLVDNSDIICFTQSAFVCVYALMTSKDLPTTLISDHVKVFLSMSHNVSDNKEYPWCKRGNIVSLLNLKDQMDTYGHIRLYWEGNRERYIQEVKPLMRNLRSTSSYFALKLKQLHNSTSLCEVMGKMSLCKQVNGQVHDTRYKSFIIYDSVQEVESFLNTKNPVSVFLYNNDGSEKTHVCCMTDTNDVGLFEVIWGCDGIHVSTLVSGTRLRYIVKIQAVTIYKIYF